MMMPKMSSITPWPPKMTWNNTKIHGKMFDLKLKPKSDICIYGLRLQNIQQIDMVSAKLSTGVRINIPNGVKPRIINSSIHKKSANLPLNSFVSQ